MVSHDPRGSGTRLDSGSLRYGSQLDDLGPAAHIRGRAAAKTFDRYHGSQAFLRARVSTHGVDKNQRHVLHRVILLLSAPVSVPSRLCRSLALRFKMSSVLTRNSAQDDATRRSIPLAHRDKHAEDSIVERCERPTGS